MHFHVISVFVVLFTFFLTGCSDKTTPQTIRFAVSTIPTNFDPRFATDAASERVNHLLYAHLVKFNDALLPEPDLANWQQITPTRYRFSLKPDRLVFTNGDKLTAKDVIATYQFVLDKNNLSPHRQSLKVIDAFKAIDDESFEVSLKHADPLFPAYMRLGILPASGIKQNIDFSKMPLGSGSFELLEKTDQKVLLQRRNDKQQILFLSVKEPIVRVLKLLNDEVDLLQNDLSPEIVGYLKQQDEIAHEVTEGRNFTYMGFNLKDPLTGNLLIRKAISHAINRRAIIKHVFNDAARLAESILPPSHWAGHKKLPTIEYNQAKARRFLKQAGYDEKNRLVLVYKTSTDPFRIRLASIIQSQLSDIGIDLEIRSHDWGTFFGDIKSGNFQLYSLSWVGINTPDIFRYVFHSDSLPPTGANRGRYVSTQVDQLLEQLTGADSLAQQQLLYFAIQEILHDDLPYMPLWYEHQQAFMMSAIKHYQVRADGNYHALKHVRRQLH